MKALPLWSRCVLALVPLRDSRAEVESDFAELFSDRLTRYGAWYAHRRLSADIFSLWRGTPRGGHMFQDLRFGVRLFRKHPLPVGLAMTGLALALGVVTAVFSVVNATKLRPYGMDDPYSIVQVTRSRFEGRMFDGSWSYRRYLEMRAATGVASVEAAMEDQARVTTISTSDPAPERPVLFVSGGYLPTLGGRAAIGRSLTPSDDRPDAPPVVVVSHDLWTSQLQSDPAALGATLWVNGAPATIVGVMQERFSSPVRTKPVLWATFAAFDDLLGVAATYTINGRTPEVLTGEPFAPTSRTYVDVLARLAPGVALPAAESRLAAVIHAAERAADPKATPSVVRLFRAASPVEGPRAAENYLEIAAILGLAGLVLAVACANAANLLLAAAATRTREIGIRLAMGATARRLLAQMVSESLLLGLVAGALGFLFAFWLSPLLAVVVGFDPGVNPTPDARVLVFAIGVAVACGLGAAIAPARFGARGNVLAALQSQGGSVGRTPVPSRLRTSFVSFQAAVSMLLLVAGALLARTALHMTSVDAGFDADRALSASVTTPQQAGFDEPAYFRRAVDAVAAIPSVESVGLSALRPFGTSVHTLRLDGVGEGYTLYMVRSDANYFPATGIRLLRGRLFTAEEAATSAPVALISESVAQRFFQGRDPLGQPVSSLPLSNKEPEGSATIVGIVADAMMHRVHTEAFGSLHRPLRHSGDPKAVASMGPPTLIVRTTNPAGVAREVEDVLRRLDGRVRPSTWILSDAIRTFAGEKRMLAWLAAPMAGLALVLAALGIYGVTAFIVSRRTQEVSVRMAMGASGWDVMRLLVGDGLRPVLLGLGIGLGAAILAARVFASIFTGVSPYDPLAIVMSVATLLLPALVAVVIPARRAARLDPASILRES